MYVLASVSIPSIVSDIVLAGRYTTVSDLLLHLDDDYMPILPFIYYRNIRYDRSREVVLAEIGINRAARISASNAGEPIYLVARSSDGCETRSGNLLDVVQGIAITAIEVGLGQCSGRPPYTVYIESGSSSVSIAKVYEGVSISLGAGSQAYIGGSA